MFVRLSLLGALAACGRLGFSDEAIGVDALRGGDATSTADAPPLLGAVTCATTRSPLGVADAVEIVAEAAAAPMLAWRTSTGAVGAAVLASDNRLGTVYPLFGGAQVERITGAHPYANGHMLSIEQGGAELLYAISSSFGVANLRGSGRAGAGRGTLTGFGSYVFWGHVASTQSTALLFERVDATGVTTLQSNRTAASEIRDLVVTGAVDSHAHLVWAEADGTCTASELFGGVPDLVDVRTLPDCRSPRNASGIDDSIATAYATPSGALRMYAIAGAYEHDFELTPAGHDPVVADDGTSVWASWFDDRVGGALVIAKIELTATAATVTARQLEAVAPAGPAAIALVGDARPPRLLILEAGALAVVEPCL